MAFAPPLTPTSSNKTNAPMLLTSAMTLPTKINALAWLSSVPPDPKKSNINDPATQVQILNCINGGISQPPQH